jgi:hypothetical protein
MPIQHMGLSVVLYLLVINHILFGFKFVFEILLILGMAMQYLDELDLLVSFDLLVLFSSL